ncbi:MAG: transposase [Brachymonas sp.]|nr:transposase [Brachymonas sp.]
MRQAYKKAHEKYPVETIAICILPDHLHALWQMPPNDGDFSLRWRLLKYYFSAHFAPHAQRSASKARKNEKGLWQRRFWEHQIRDEEDLQRHIDYIHFNPVKHGLVQRASDWPHSSIHRYIAQGSLPSQWGLAVDLEGNFGEE